MATLNEESRRYLFDRSAPAVGDIATLENILSRKKYGAGSARSGRPMVALAASALLGMSLALWMPDEPGVKAEGGVADARSNSGLPVSRTQPWDLQVHGDQASEGPDKSAPFVVLIGGEESQHSIGSKPKSAVPQVDLGAESASETGNAATLATHSAAD